MLAQAFMPLNIFSKKRLRGVRQRHVWVCDISADQPRRPSSIGVVARGSCSPVTRHDANSTPWHARVMACVSFVPSSATACLSSSGRGLPPKGAQQGALVRAPVLSQASFWTTSRHSSAYAPYPNGKGNPPLVEGYRDRCSDVP